MFEVVTKAKKSAVPVLAALVSAGIVAGGAVAADDRGDAQQASRVAAERTAMVRAHVADTARQAAAAVKHEAEAVAEGRARQKRYDKRQAAIAMRKLRKAERKRAEKLAERARSAGYSSGSAQGYASGSSDGYRDGASDGYVDGVVEASDELDCSDDSNVTWLPYC